MEISRSVGRDVVTLIAVAVATVTWTTSAGSKPPPQRDRYYLGPVFERLPVTASEAVLGEAWSVIYGDCEPPPPEGGCAPPLEIQSWSLCVRHPLEIDVLPRRITRLRGVPVIDYGDGLEVLTGATDAVVFGDDARQMRRAVAALRRMSGPARIGEPLTRPRLPRWVLRELKLVRVLRARGLTRRALRRRLGISVSAIRMREQLAAALGRHALRGVSPATTRPADIIRDRQALIAVQELGVRRATPAERRGAARQRHRRRVC